MELQYRYTFRDICWHKSLLGKLLFLCGIVLLIALFIAQYKMIESFFSFDKITLTELQMKFMNDIAISVFVFYNIGATLIITGIIMIFQGWKNETHFPYSTNPIKKYYYILKSNIIFIFSNSKSRRVFFIAFVSYFLISLFLNNSIIYKSSIPMSNTNEFNGPSVYVIGCCGTIGSFPVVNIHLLSNLGFLLIPINIIIPLFYSMLISLTVSIISLSIQDKVMRKKNIQNKSTCSIIGFSAFSGFFISCPTCTSNVLLTSVLGTGILASSSLLLSTYQYVIAVFNFAIAIVVLIFLMKRYSYRNRTLDQNLWATPSIK